MPEKVSPPTESLPSLAGVVATLVLDAAAAEVTAALRRTGIQSRLLKGAVIAAWLYDDGGRSYVDVDILVAPRELARAEQVLRQLDFSADVAEARGNRTRHARVWERAGDGAMIDLHTTLIGIGLDEEEAWEVLARAPDHLVVGAETVETLDVPARALHLALHAAQHGARSPQALADLERAISRLPSETWRESEALARRLDALPAFVAGLRLATNGEAMADGLGMTRVSSVEAVLRAGVVRDRKPPPSEEETLGSALALEWLSGVGMRERAAFVLRKVAPTPAAMKRRSPLARRGRLGLAAAYVLRPIRMVPHAVAGFVVWRRARRRTR